MSKYLLAGLAVSCLAVFVTDGALAAPKRIDYQGKAYFVVDGNDPALDSGNEVCAAVGGTCVGYTAYTTEVCKKAHSGASVTTSVNGSKAGFYCDGPPQKGLACENARNNCQVCPQCNVNADCSTAVGEQFREMYVECAGVPEASVEPSWWGKLRSSIAHWLNSIRDSLRRTFTGLLVKRVTVQVKDAKGNVSSAELPPDVYACEFFQVTKKLVTCGAVKAADTFCVQAFGSRFAKAVLCQENGAIVCVNPCNPPEQQVKPARCAFDNERARGNQAPPLDFCNETITITPAPSQALKRAGQECAHGGECATGICLGQPSDQGIKYFCSCSQTRHDTSCNP